MNLTRFGVECRAEMHGDKLGGHAAVFGQVARLPGHWERLADTAFKRALDDPAVDVRALFNHDPSHLLGRTASGTLRVGVDTMGLEFEVDLPNTQLGRDVRELVERGDITGASFGFIPDEDEWGRGPNGLRMRTHTSVRRLVDVSPVTFPAYEGASTQMRAMVFGEESTRSKLIRARARVLLGGS